MTEIFAQFVAEVRPNLVDEIEAAYGRAFADLRLEIANLRLEPVKLNGGALRQLIYPTRSRAWRTKTGPHKSRLFSDHLTSTCAATEGRTSMPILKTISIRANLELNDRVYRFGKG